MRNIINRLAEKSSYLYLLTGAAFALACLLTPFGSKAFFAVFITAALVGAAFLAYSPEHNNNSSRHQNNDAFKHTSSSSRINEDRQYINHTAALYGCLTAAAKLQAKDNTEYFKLFSYLNLKLWHCPDDLWKVSAELWFTHGRSNPHRLQEHLDYLIACTLKQGRRQLFAQTICALAECVNLLRVNFSQPISGELKDVFWEIFRQYRKTALFMPGSAGANLFAPFFTQGDLTLSLQSLLQGMTGTFFNSADDFKAYFERSEAKQRFTNQQHGSSQQSFADEDELINHALALYGNLAAISGRYEAHKQSFEQDAVFLCKALAYGKYQKQQPNLAYFYRGLEENGILFKTHLKNLVNCTLKAGRNQQFEQTFCCITGFLGMVTDPLRPHKQEIAAAIFEMLYQYQANVTPRSLSTLHHLYTTFFLVKQNPYSKYLKVLLKEAVGTACAREETFCAVFTNYSRKRSQQSNFNNSGNDQHSQQSNRQSDQQSNQQRSQQSNQQRSQQNKQEQSRQNQQRSRGSKSNEHTGKAQSANPQDPYVILGLSPEADFETIRRQYHRLANHYHPDKTKDLPEQERLLAEAKFKEISSAYEKLKSRFGR